MLGVRCFFKLNKAFLSKWLLGFANEIDSLWRKVLCSKFKEERRIGAPEWFKALRDRCVERNQKGMGDLLP